MFVVQLFSPHEPAQLPSLCFSGLWPLWRANLMRSYLASRTYVISAPFWPAELDAEFTRPTLQRSYGIGKIPYGFPPFVFSRANFFRIRAVFVPTQIINFAFVPHHLRFVVVSVVSLFWSESFCPSNAIGDVTQM